MAELRWNPLLGTWTMVAPHRQARPVVASRGCPFCPGSGKVPDQYEVLAYDNDYPTLSQEPEQITVTESALYRVKPAYGKCEVILYSSSHDASLWNLPQSQVRNLVELWAERSEALASDMAIKYVFPFENRGAEVGVTIHHPHGQIYAYPFVPLKVQVELDRSREHFGSTGRCLICDMNLEEISSGKRVIAENDGFVVYLPFFTDYPFGTFVVPKRHLVYLSELDDTEREDLASILRNLTGAFDLLYQRPFPYMMCLHQGPVNSAEYAEAKDYYHFHIEFYPPLRDAEKIKYYASSEMGAWAACNPLSVEDSAVMLREAYHRFVGDSEK
ncbi:MAG: galactose-1-phosphate uridylyltransferase [Bacillota bacterium]